MKQEDVPFERKKCCNKARQRGHKNLASMIDVIIECTDFEVSELPCQLPSHAFPPLTKDTDVAAKCSEAQFRSSGMPWIMPRPSASIHT